MDTLLETRSISNHHERDQQDTGEPDTLREGQGTCTSHFGEIAQGVAVTHMGRLERCLVTMPCDLFHASATFVPEDRTGIRVSPGTYWKARAAAERTLGAMNLSGRGGHLKIIHNIPEKLGCGGSTATVVATIRAVAASQGKTLSPETIAHITVESELASDSIMFSSRANAVLFAHRKGNVVEEFPGPLPKMYVLGFNTDAEGEGVDTLKYPRARYSSYQIEQFRVVWALIRNSCRTQDVEALGRAATLSARIDQEFLPKPGFTEALSLVSEAKALGIHVSHSGTVAGLIFAPATPSAVLDEVQERLHKLGLGPFWQFHVGDFKP